MSRRALWCGVLPAAGLLAMLFGSLVLIPRLLHPPLAAADLDRVAGAETRIRLQQAQSELQNDARTGVLQGLAGLLVVAGAAAAWRQAQVSREGQATERFTHCVDQLGSGNLDVRVGGIHALERVAASSPTDRPAVQYILGSFVRGHAPWDAGPAHPPGHPAPAPDQHLP
jgi:hypothetical protein